MRLIDADKLEPHEIYDGNDFTEVVYMDDIREMPTVEAEPIRHGYWEALYAHEEPTSNVYRCSNCGKGFADYLNEDYDYYNESPVFFEYDRCPHCGAIMDGNTVFPPYRPDGQYSEYWKNRIVEVED